MAIIGIVPAAGRGTRLSPLPFSKELFPIGYQDIELDGEIKKRPKVVSQYLVDHIVDAGAERLFIIVGPGKSDIMEYFGDGSNHGIEIAYMFQREAQGMPFALDLGFSHLGKEDTVVFGMSDTIVEPRGAFKKVLDGHQAKSADLTLGLFATDNPSKFGMVDFDANSNEVSTTTDKPATTSLTHMWGFCIWNYTFASYMHDYLLKLGDVKKEIVFGDVINAAIKNGLRVCAFPVEEGRYIDIGTVEDLDAALKNFHLG